MVFKINYKRLVVNFPYETGFEQFELYRRRDRSQVKISLFDLVLLVSLLGCLLGSVKTLIFLLARWLSLFLQNFLEFAFIDLEILSLLASLVLLGWLFLFVFSLLVLVSFWFIFLFLFLLAIIGLFSRHSSELLQSRVELGKFFLLHFLLGQLLFIIGLL